MTENIESGPFVGEDSPGSIPERSYRRPPIVEALCEVYFSKTSWNASMPEEFHERIKQEFPNRQTKTTHRADITIGDSGTASTEVRDLDTVFQFLTEAGDQIVQVSDNLLVVNQLLPYRHFREWESLLDRVLDIYEELASPQRVDRVGLRYINRFEIPGSGKTIAMEEFFTIFPTIPQSLGEEHGPFLVQLEVLQNNDRHSLLITFGPKIFLNLLRGSTLSCWTYTTGFP